MRQSLVVRAFMVAALFIVPLTASAQVIAGTARDASGGVLPGVTVEASSPALIEKVRSAVTDGSGQYRIQALPVGVYEVRFTLPGFTPVTRTNVVLNTGFTATIDADLRVGLTETVSVTGEAPIVDVENARQQLVVDGDELRQLPSGRTANALLNLVPALQGSNGICTGGTCGYTLNAYSAHGGNAAEGRLQVDGMGVGAAIGGAGVSGYLADVANSQEISFTLSGSLGEAEVGGPVINVVPRTGGNRYTASYFTSYTQTRMFDKNNGEYPHINISNLREKDYDVNGSFGGPLVRDRLWFFFAPRIQGSTTTRPNAYYNLNEGVFGANYAPDLSRPAKGVDEAKNASLRLTLQASARNKFNLFWDEQAWCITCEGTSGAGTSPEAATVAFVTPNHIAQASWTNPFTGRLLFEAGVSLLNQKWGISARPGGNNIYYNIPRIQETGQFAYNNGITSGGATNWDADAGNQNIRASVSYVTGAHNMKVGYQGAFLNEADYFFVNDHRVHYTYGTRAGFTVPVPTGVQISYPVFADERTSFYGIYAQDQWTLNRFTIQGAVRYDHAWSWFPEVCVNEDVFVPESFCFGQANGRTEGVSYDDITPRWSAAWDVFGDGKTAIKYNMGKYLQPANVGGLYNATNPVRRLGNFFGFGAPLGPAFGSRGWEDLDGDRIVDCDLRNQAANGECQAFPGSLAQFGTDPRTNGQGFTNTQCGRDESEFGGAVNQAVLDYCQGIGTGAPDGPQNIVDGWGKREYDWQFGLGVQHEVLPRVSVEVTYNRRWYGNFQQNDNISLGCNLDQACLENNLNFVNPHYDFYSITVPDDPNLPGAGRTITGLTNLDPTFNGRPTLTATTITENETRYWHGVDTNVNWRAPGGLRLQGGTSTGRQVTDDCANAVDDPNQRNCHVALPFQTNVRGSASYVIPKVDVLLSTIFQYRPGVQRSANYTITCPGGVCPADVFQWDPQSVTTTGAAPGTTVPRTNLLNSAPSLTVNLLDTGTLYGEGYTTFDIKVAKVLRFGRTRTNIGLDVYNAFNSDAATGYANSYPTQNVAGFGQVPWGTVTNIVTPRFARVSLQFDF
jgi:hypothetical protein